MGGSAHEAGGNTFFDQPWASVLVDLVAGPDNWQLVRQVPGDRGVVCAGLRVREDEVEVDQQPELVWASQYAASANGRGLTRVGLTNATRLADRSPAAARASPARRCREVRADAIADAVSGPGPADHSRRATHPDQQPRFPPPPGARGQANRRLTTTAVNGCAGRWTGGVPPIAPPARRPGGRPTA
ncbi:MAG: hypothetical protein U0838_14505 [Chloroflexota bacterium]